MGHSKMYRSTKDGYIKYGIPINKRHRKLQILYIEVTYKFKINLVGSQKIVMAQNLFVGWIVSVFVGCGRQESLWYILVCWVQQALEFDIKLEQLMLVFRKNVEEKDLVVQFLFALICKWVCVFWCCSLECFNGERFLRVCRHTNEVCWCYGPFGLLCVNRFVKNFVLKVV